MFAPSARLSPIGINHNLYTQNARNVELDIRYRKRGTVRAKCHYHVLIYTMPRTQRAQCEFYFGRMLEKCDIPETNIEVIILIRTYINPIRFASVYFIT